MLLSLLFILQDVGIKPVAQKQIRKKKSGKRNFKAQNVHLADVLQDYGELKANKTS